MVNIYFDNRQAKMEISEDIHNLLKAVIKTTLLIENKKGDFEVSVSFVDNDEIKELNKNYRGMDKETDVLSFPIENQLPIPVAPLGDIIISVEKAIDQAKDYNHSLGRELAYLTGHSMFHLLGYDHIEENEQRLMREKEKTLMKRLGIFKDFKREQDL